MAARAIADTGKQSRNDERRRRKSSLLSLSLSLSIISLEYGRAIRESQTAV
jgi:hypothetical protein